MVWHCVDIVMGPQEREGMGHFDASAGRLREMARLRDAESVVGSPFPPMCGVILHSHTFFASAGRGSFALL